MEKDLDTSFEIVPQQQASASDNMPSVYVPEYGLTVKTDIDDPFLIRYMAGRKWLNIPRDDFFGMEDLKISQGELANGIISQAARGMAGTAASFAMTTYRAAKGFGGSLMDIAKRDWQLKDLEDKKTNDTAYLQEQKAKGKLTEEEYKKRLAELETQYISLASQIHKKFLEADEAANREMERLKKANEEWLKRAGLAKTGRDGFVYDLAAGTMSLAFAVGATMAFKSPAAGGALFGLITGREDYEEAIENGKSRETAAYLGLAGGSASWVLESLGVDNIFRTLKNAGLLKHFAKGAIGEFAEEFGQNIADDAIMIKYGGRKKTTRQIVEDAIAAGVIGGIIGGFFGGTIGYYNDYQQTKAELSQRAQNVDDKGNIIDENGNIAGKAEPEEAPETKAQAKRDVDPGYLNWVYQDTVNKLMENGLDREAAENLAGRAMGKAADIVSTVIPQMIDHELNEATLEGQADEIAAQLRETIQNLGKKRPLKKAFRQEIEQIYNEELEKGKAQGLKAEEAEFYAKMHATRIMWESAYTGLSPRFIAEQVAIELRNERAEAAQQRELPGTYIHKEEDGTYSLKGRYYAGSYYKSGRIKENRGWEDVEETGTIFEGFKTEEEARAFASRLAEMQEDLPGSGGAKAERAGLPRRPKNSQAGKGLLKMLGFKDVKTGRELTKGEEKALASAAYDGIYDLAEILNIPPESLSLNGTLTIKLGAPKTDIKPGEGAKYRAKDKTIIMEAEAGSGRFAAAWYAAFTDYMQSPDIRPEMKAAFKELRKAINSRKLTAEEIRHEQEKSLKEAEKGLKEANDAIDNSEVSFELYELVDEINSSNRYIEAYPIEEENLFDGKPQERQAGVDNRIIDEAYQAAGEQGARLISDLIAAHNNIIAVESMDFSTDLSRFAADYSAATGKTTADSKEKSASETELESAAFASYIYNRLLEKGGKNTFLTRPDKGRTFDVRRALREDAEIIPDAEPGEAGDPFAYPYPVGRERKEIFKAFDNVFSTLKWETTEQGTRLYQPPIVDEVNIKNKVEILDLSNHPKKIKTEKALKAFIQQLIDDAKNNEVELNAKTKNGHTVNIIDEVKTPQKKQPIPKHLSYSSMPNRQIKQRPFIVSNIFDLIEYSFWVDETAERKGKIGYDKVYRYYVPVRLDNNTVYAVRIVALHKTNEVQYKSDIYDVIATKEGRRYLPKQINAQRPPAAGAAGIASDNISIADLLRNVKDSDGFPYIQNDDEIRIDGKYVHMKNSEGNYIASTVKDLRNFYKWFGNSKVVDNDGRPLVMYHGTPNKGFEEFNTPSHFSPDKKYAEGYQTPNASAMGFKQNSDNPGTYSVYLSIKNPFDARNDEAREIFLNEYRAYYSPELTDRGMVDWMEAEDLIEWLKENHPEYDGLIVDEGGTGGYGEAVKSRGDSYLPFEPAQIKSVENTGEFDPKNPNIYYQPSETQNGIAESEKYRGKTEWFRDSARTIITLFRSADASTLPHELAHVFMLDLQRMAKLNPDGRLGQILKDLKETVGEPQGEVAGEYSVEQQEKFARLFERYIAEGYAPDKGWRRLFAIFKDWLRSIYRTFKDFPELSPAAKDLFDRWLSFDDASNIPDMETLKEYRGKINALKTVAEAAKENRDIEEDGITAQDLKTVLNVTRMDRPEDAEAQKAYNEALAIADEITESQAEANGLLEKIEDMEHRGARQFDSRDVAMFDRAIEQIEAIQAGKDTESGGTSFYQSAKAAGDDRNLAVVHNISARAFSKAIDLGGFPVPSIGIINKDQHFYVGGSITLVGDKRMIDPARSENEVYNRDIWSRTFPAVDYRKPSSKSLASFRKKYNPYFERTQETISSILYTSQSSNPAPAIGEFENALAAKVAYIETVQKEKADIELKDRSLEQLAEAMSDRYGIKVDSQFLEEAEKAYSLPEEEKKKAIETAVIHAFEKIDFSRYGEDAEEFKAIQRENLFDKDGKLTFRAFDNIEYSIGKWIAGRGKMTADHWALRDVLDKQIKDNEAYHEWAVKTVQEDLLGEPMLRIGRTLKPFTLENITQAMIRGTTKNAQDALIFEAGKVIAAGAKRLKSIEEIKSEGKKLITPEKALEQQEAVSQIIIDFANKVSKLGNSSSSSVRVSFETAMRRGEAAMRALAKIAESKKPSAVALSKALDYELGQKETYSRELLAEGVKIADTVRGLARDYFEAKPQRAVGLDEFTGAIIPTKGEYDKIAKKAEQAGYKVVRSDNQTEALKTFENSFFQSSKEPDRFRREDYAYGFRPEKDTKAAIRKINAVIEDLIKEVEKRKGDEAAKAAVIKTLRSAIGYKGYLARVRQARSIIDEAQRRMSDQKLPFKEQTTLTPEKRAEIIKVRTDPEKQKEIDRKAGKSEHENWDRAKEYARDLGRSVSDRAAGISPKLKLAFREFTRKFNLERTAHSKALEPFIKAYREMSEDDRAVFDWAAFNGDTKTIEEYKQKYKDLAPALETYRQVLDDIYMKAAEAGFDVGYIQDYFPRKVKDYTAFKTFLKGTKEWTFIEEYLKKELNIKDPDKWMTDGQHDDVLADIINRYMRGTGIEGRGNGKPGNIKKRRIIEITPEQMHFYYGLDESILMYAASMDKAIQARKLFGYDLLHEEDTVGMIVKDIVEERKAAHAKNPEIPELTTDDEAELMKDINAFLHPKGPGKLAQTIKDWGYMLTLVSPISTITQLEDLSVAIVENGAGRTVSAAFETARKKGKKIALEDIGVEQYDIDINSGRMSQKILGTALKATGFSAFDRFGKETFILSDFNKRAEQVKKNKADFIAECEMYGYEPERIKNMVECFLKGDINDINDDAKSLLFYDLAEVQPIDLAEMPVYYLRGGTWRIAYALKTFTLKRLNYLITKTQRLAKKGQILWDNGDQAGAMAEWAKGVGIMTWTLFLLVAAGASMDWLKDLILRRQSDVPSLLVDNLLKQASFNRWEVKRVAQEGITDILFAKITPPVLVTAEDLRRDAVRIGDGKLSVKDMKIWNQFPVIGRFYYWWFGGGKLITEKQKEKEARKKRAKKRQQKQRRRE